MRFRFAKYNGHLQEKGYNAISMIGLDNSWVSGDHSTADSRWSIVLPGPLCYKVDQWPILCPPVLLLCSALPACGATAPGARTGHSTTVQST